MRGLIVTVDDFGAAVAVNEAVERGFREGIVTAASLMVSGGACDDAVDRARRLPGLGVGLHVVLVDGSPVLPPDRVPALVGTDGRFHLSMMRTAFALALSPAARAQMRAEVEAQFATFAATGLRLDHVNAHKHFHLHPMIASAIIQVGTRYGMRAVRVPHERATPWAMRWWSRRLASRLRKSGMLINDQVLGLRWSGAFDAARMRQALSALSDGLTELYCHAASADAYPGSAPGYRYREELAALLDPGVRAALAAGATKHGCFGDFTMAAAG